MGSSILALVLSALREAGFAADHAYPGQKFCHITDPVAAVHLEKVESASGTVTVEVNILCPAAMGGAACELAALRAAEVLRQRGALCVQKGCRFEGGAQAFSVPVMAAFASASGGEEKEIGPGFLAFLNERQQTFARFFSGEESCGAQAEYAMGQPGAVGICGGTKLWTVRLEELIPVGETEAEEPEGAFDLRIETEKKVEVYRGCRWKSIRREFSQEGLKRIRQGIALERVEV